MVTILKYKENVTYYSIYINCLSDGTVSYLTVSTDDIVDTTNNETEFPELRRVFEEDFEIKFQEGSVLKYLNFIIYQSPLGFVSDNTDHIMELVNGWLPTGTFIKFDTHFRKVYTYKKELMAALKSTGNALHKAEMECHGKFGHTLGKIQNISLMSRIDIFHISCCLATQTVAPNFTSFQVIK